MSPHDYNKNMKIKLLPLFLLCSTFLTSCQKEPSIVDKDNIINDGSVAFKIANNKSEESRTKVIDNYNIGDSCYVSIDVEPLENSNIQTKGSLIDNNTISTMGVTGYYTKNSSFNPSSSVANYLINEKVSKNGSSWSYSNKKFWPTDTNDKISFFAYAPHFTPTSGGETQTTILNFNSGGTPKITYTTFEDPDSQYDLMVAIPLLNMAKPQINTPLEFTMKHVLSSIGFIVTGYGETFNKISFEGIYRTATLNMDVTSNIVWENYSNISDNTNAPRVKIDRVITTSSEEQQVHTDDGFMMLVPQTIPDDAYMVIQLDNTDIKRVKIKNFIAKFEPGLRYIFNIRFKNPDEIEVDLTNEVSNCFLLNPVANKNVTYKLPIKQVNRFWGNSTYNSPTPSNQIIGSESWQVGLLWQDSQNLVSPSGETSITISKSSGNGIDDYFSIRIPKGAVVKSGNFLIGISTNGTPSLTETSAGITNILWSWHIWITDYNPYGTKGSPSQSGNGTVTPIPGGNLYTYTNGTLGSGDKTLWGNQYSYILDRNIGALIPNHTSQNYQNGMITYQFGRKDPLPGNVTLYDINNNSVPYSTSSNNYTLTSSSDPKPTLAWSVYHPLRFIALLPQSYYPTTSDDNSGRWCYDHDGSSGYWHDPTVTTASGKSLFDPSPQQFRVPIIGTWSNINQSVSYFNSQTGYNYPPFIYPISFERRSSTGQIIQDSYGYIYLWSGSVREPIGGSIIGKGTAYSLFLSYEYIEPSYSGNSSKAIARAIRPVQ